MRSILVTFVFLASTISVLAGPLPQESHHQHKAHGHGEEHAVERTSSARSRTHSIFGGQLAPVLDMIISLVGFVSPGMEVEFGDVGAVEHDDEGKHKHKKPHHPPGPPDHPPHSHPHHPPPHGPPHHPPPHGPPPHHPPPPAPTGTDLPPFPPPPGKGPKPPKPTGTDVPKHPKPPHGPPPFPFPPGPPPPGPPGRKHPHPPPPPGKGPKPPKPSPTDLPEDLAQGANDEVVWGVDERKGNAMGHVPHVMTWGPPPPPSSFEKEPESEALPTAMQDDS